MAFDLTLVVAFNELLEFVVFELMLMFITGAVTLTLTVAFELEFDTCTLVVLVAFVLGNVEFITVTVAFVLEFDRAAQFDTVALVAFVAYLPINVSWLFIFRIRSLRRNCSIDPKNSIF